MADNSAAGAQPGSLPAIHHTYRADAKHYTKGRWRIPLLGISDRIEYAVLHNTEGRDSRAWLSTTSNPPASIHALIDRAGARWNIVDYNDTAWHVGKARSPYRNSNSLGLELENRSNPRGVSEDYTPAQINTAAHWLATVMFSYGIPWLNVVRHGDIALPAGRRADPSNFPMDDFRLRTDAWLLFFRNLPEASHSLYII